MEASVPLLTPSKCNKEWEIWKYQRSVWGYDGGVSQGWNPWCALSNSHQVTFVFGKSWWFGVAMESYSFRRGSPFPSEGGRQSLSLLSPLGLDRDLLLPCYHSKSVVPVISATPIGPILRWRSRDGCAKPVCVCSIWTELTSGLLSFLIVVLSISLLPRIW